MFIIAQKQQDYDRLDVEIVVHKPYNFDHLALVISSD